MNSKELIEEFKQTVIEILQDKTNAPIKHGVWLGVKVTMIGNLLLEHADVSTESKSYVKLLLQELTKDLATRYTQDKHNQSTNP